MKKSQKISSIMPEGEGIAQVFTLDQLCMNPDNPRKSRNPRYDDIKASVRSQGLNSIPLVTRDPRLPEEMWTFSDGGNTRYAIMRELWNETGDPRFYRMTCVVKPWAGRFQCLTGHLVENETHGQLTFIDKALSVQDARQLLEDERGKKVSLRELAVALAQHGLPVHYSSVSRMEDVIRHIYPWMPELLRSGFGGQELRKLIKLRSSAESVWEKFQAEKFVETKEDFTSVFGQCCRKFDSPDLWSLEMFTDELIGDLTEAFPCEELNYDGWLLELKCNRQPDAVVTDKDTPFVTAGEIMSAAELDEGNPENVSESDWPQSDPSQYAKERSPASPKPSEPDPVKPEPLSVEYSTAHDSSEQPENTPDIFWADPDSLVTDPQLKKVLRDNAGLGTEATRSGVLETLFKRGFLGKKGKFIQSTQMARELIAALPETLTSPGMTALWEQALDDIAQGKNGLSEFMQKQTQWTRHLIEKGRVTAFKVTAPVGPACPQCGGPTRLRKNKEGKFWGCMKFPDCKGIVGETNRKTRRQAAGKSRGGGKAKRGSASAPVTIQLQSQKG